MRVVLVRPERPQNVGAVARIIRNTGLEALDLVAPGDWRTVECWRTAWGAQEVLEQARVFDELPAALAGSVLTVAFSARRGDAVPAQDVREVAGEIASLPREGQASLVFGPETSGLTLAEMELCGRRSFIPSAPGQPSLNLSHAVMVAAYEAFRAGRPPRADTGPQWAAWEQKARLLDLLREGLLAVGALPPERVEGHFAEWTAMLQRLSLTRREVRLLEHMARKMARQ